MVGGYSSGQERSSRPLVAERATGPCRLPDATTGPAMCGSTAKLPAPSTLPCRPPRPGAARPPPPARTFTATGASRRARQCCPCGGLSAQPLRHAWRAGSRSDAALPGAAPVAAPCPPRGFSHATNWLQISARGLDSRRAIPWINILEGGARLRAILGLKELPFCVE
jgi:hypothetical protein